MVVSDVRFVRTSTAIGIADAAGAPRLQTSFGSYVGDHSTTNEVGTDMSGNYFFGFANHYISDDLQIQGFIAGTTQYVGRSIRDNNGVNYDARSSSSFTLMEVLA